MVKRTPVREHTRRMDLNSPDLKREEHTETRQEHLQRLFDGTEEERKLALYGLWNDYERDHPQPRSGSNGIFANWFLARFPDQHDLHYAEQWVFRFHSGTPTIYMDKGSTELYIKEVKRWNGIE